MIALNDTSPNASQTAANLTALGEVAYAALYGTSSVSALVLTKAIAAGASDYITKPVEIDQLVAMMRVWLDA